MTAHEYAASCIHVKATDNPNTSEPPLWMSVPLCAKPSSTSTTNFYWCHYKNIKCDGLCSRGSLFGPVVFTKQRADVNISVIYWGLLFTVGPPACWEGCWWCRGAFVSICVRERDKEGPCFWLWGTCSCILTCECTCLCLCSLLWAAAWISLAAPWHKQQL